MLFRLSRVSHVDAVVYCNESGGIVRQEICGDISKGLVQSAAAAVAEGKGGFKPSSAVFQKLGLSAGGREFWARPHEEGFLLIAGRKGVPRNELEKSYAASSEVTAQPVPAPTAKDPNRVVIEDIRMPWRTMIAAVLGSLVLGAICLMVMMPSRLSDEGGARQAYASTPPENTKTLITLHGSNTIGAEMAPALAEAFLKLKGAGDVRKIPGKNNVEVRIEGTIPGEGSRGIEIAAHGSTTGFKGLDAETCDVGMSSRPIKGKEIIRLERLGDMKRPGAENVVAMDGIAVIVHPDNKIQSLSAAQIADLFSGTISNWSQIPGTGIDAPVRVFARDSNSGTWDTFKGLVLKPRQLKLREDAKRFEDSHALSREVSRAPGGIGFIGLPYIKPSKAVRVFDKGTAPVFPTLFTVATEDYLLARRLYVYVPPAVENEEARQFVRFALSDQGQEIAEKVGFIPLGVFEKALTAEELEDAPKLYRQYSKGANRLSLNFRFRPGSDRPDTKALRDMDRLMEYLGRDENRGRKLRLFGFADGRMSRKEACGLAQRRAEHLSRVFEAYGIASDSIQGFCSDMPVASNAKEKTAKKNNRVEIWLEKRKG